MVLPGKKRVGRKSVYRREYTDEELELLKAVDKWRQNNQPRHLPTICDILKIMKDMGYEKVKHANNSSVRAAT
ncbi:hypothetical protein KAR91_60930 [Candidatus Pacearchaeota archaeon]|nr:hypothetical protein [Candidatus Pacearchaeota archaeon]